MSILIKGCKLPSYCDECPVEYDGMCRLLKYKDTEYHKRLDDCPLIAFDTDDVAPADHGHWIYGEDESGQDGYSCSECDFFVPWYYKYYEQGLHFIKDYHLCPQCGAKMDENEEKEV